MLLPDLSLPLTRPPVDSKAHINMLQGAVVREEDAHRSSPRVVYMSFLLVQ